MAKWAGIIGSAMKGVADVAVPAALENRRAALQAKRDAVLLQHEAQQAAMHREFTSGESAAGRAHETGLIGQRMAQDDRHHSDIIGQRKTEHQAQVDYNDARLQLERDSLARGDSQSMSSDRQLLQYFEDRLGKTPEEAVQMWQDSKNDPNKFVEKFVIEAMRAHSSAVIPSNEPFDAEAAAQEGASLYETIRERESSAPASGQDGVSADDPLGIRRFLEGVGQGRGQ